MMKTGYASLSARSNTHQIATTLTVEQLEALFWIVEHFDEDNMRSLDAAKSIAIMQVKENIGIMRQGYLKL